jgi:hypothetical protein
VIADVQAARRNKRLRSLAKSAAYQLRYLIDKAAMESFLCRAALVAMEGASPTEWLEAQVQLIKEEQTATRTEHALMASRAAEVGHERQQ